MVAVQAAHAGDFKGPYVGLYGTAAPSHSDAFTSTVFSPVGYFAASSTPAIAAAGAQHLKPQAFGGGGLFGVNLQKGSIVVGFETDFGSFKIDETQSAGAVYPCCAPTAFTVTHNVKTDWMLSARPRLGVTHGPFLIYGTAGVGVTRFELNEVFIDTFATAHESATVQRYKKGLLGGGGVEFKLKGHWSAKGEYLHGEFGSVSTTSNNLTAFSPPIAFPTNVFSHTADFTTDMFRFGLNYHF